MRKLCKRQLKAGEKTSVRFIEDKRLWQVLLIDGAMNLALNYLEYFINRQ